MLNALTVSIPASSLEFENGAVTLHLGAEGIARIKELAAEIRELEGVASGCAPG